MEPRFETLVELLRWRAATQPTKPAVAFTTGEGDPDEELTYDDLDRHARALAASLLQPLSVGDRALLVYPPGLDFVVAFFGCLYAGVIAVPAHPPLAQTRDRLSGIAADARPKVVLTTAVLAPIVEAALADTDVACEVRCQSTDSLAANDWFGPELSSENVAFLQYTSGSTAEPRGVMVSHGNVLHNSESISRGFGHGPRSRGVIWLPPYHDMGLIGGVIQPIYLGSPVTLLSPLSFLKRPVRWLETISRTRGTTSGGPNFAYELCLRKVTPEQAAGLDLSSWDVAFTGAEPVRAKTLERFAAMFAPYGFQAEAFYPCYGLAEATLFVSGGAKGQQPVSETVRVSALEDGVALSVPPDSPDSRRLVGCGRAGFRDRVKIVDPATAEECPRRRVGEIWVSGDSVARGYWRRVPESERAFRARVAGDPAYWLRTGDIGYIGGDELFIVTRLKDMIVIAGRNHFAEDIEAVVEASNERLRENASAAFAVDGDTEERLVVVAELRSTGPDLAAVTRDVRHAVAQRHGVRVHSVVLVQRGTVPRTTSGKVRRNECRRQFLTGALKVVDGV